MLAATSSSGDGNPLQKPTPQNPYLYIGTLTPCLCRIQLLTYLKKRLPSIKKTKNKELPLYLILCFGTVLSSREFDLYRFLCKMIKGGEFEIVFRHLDKNGDGKVSPTELSHHLGLMGEELVMKDAEIAVESLDSDGDGLLGLEDFVRLMEAGGEEEKLQDLRIAFQMYDVDNCGVITPKNLKRMLSRLGESKSIDECKVMIKQFDLNGDGVLSFDEFSIMML